MARILLIDDETNIRTMIRLVLEQTGHVVMTAADGLEGLEKFREGGEWDLVLLDQRMPGLDGLEVLRQIRCLRPMVAVVMITAFGTVDLAVQAMEAGARDFLRKPFTAETLRGVVQAAVAAAPSRPMQTGDSIPTLFHLTTINGYRLRALSLPGAGSNGEIQQIFSAVGPGGRIGECVVSLQLHFLDVVRARMGWTGPPSEDPFWQALCEESLANYLWQHCEVPADGRLCVDEMTGGLARWIDSLTAEERREAV